MRPFVGSEEYINGGDRSIICAQTISPTDLARLPNVADRLRKVRAFRSGNLAEKRSTSGSIKRRGISALALANAPSQFHVTVVPVRPYLTIPKVSSERREYVPIGWLDPPTVPSDLVFVQTEAGPKEFGILTSAMHMAWLRNIGGRLESRYRYSIGLVYNTFPVPAMNATQQKDIAGLAQAVLDARAAFPGATLASLYDPDLMPPTLRKAHRALDTAVDRLYRRAPFASERERVEHLFTLYEKMTMPLQAAAQPRRRRRRSVVV